MKLTVLFVDDDENVIGGIRRMMYPMRKEWEILYTTGGALALAVLREKHIDVIVSDIRMPGIDGTQLLTQVKEKYPNVVRITLSGYANDNLALRNTRIVHQSLAKPSNGDDIKRTIERAFKLRTELNNEKLLGFVNSIDELPSLPEIYLKLEKEINSPDSSIDRIANIISTDPIITAKILQLTNSAFFGLPMHVTNIKQALNYLGIKIIQNLVLSVKLFKSIDDKNSNSKLYHEVWNHSNKVAFLAKQICSFSGCKKEVCEETFLSGLLHDIGKLILLENITDKQFIDFDELKEYELNILNTSHSSIGAYLLGIWGLPDAIVEAVAYHHDEELIDFTDNTPTLFVFIANNIAKYSDLTPEEITKENIDEILDKYSKPVAEENK